MMIEEVVGDLFDVDLPAIGHGCNTKGVMGAGIAVQFRLRYPDMHAEYQRRCDAGTFQLGDVFVWPTPERIIYNLATQDLPGSSATLNAIRVSVTVALSDATDRGLTAVGLPRVGAGIGGLAWKDVRETLQAASLANQEYASIRNLPAPRLVVVTLPKEGHVRSRGDR